MRRLPHWLRNVIVTIALAVCVSVLVLRYGGDLLIATQALPVHAQVAVPLNGSIAGFVARRAGAMSLLLKGVVDHVMISLPPDSYWGEDIPQVAQRYFSERFGPGVAQKIVYCVNSADSTIEEAAAVKGCLEQEGWRHIIVVTSLYHSRRAGIIWRSTLGHADPHFELWVDGVVDADFHPQGWWRHRRYAKTWFFEAYKLVFESIMGAGPWKGPPVKTRLIGPGKTPGVSRF
jgi:hypothetical protein